MRPNKDRRTEIILYGLLLIPLLFTAAALAQATEQAQGLAEITAVLSEILHTPSMLCWCASTPKFLLAVLVLYPLAVYCYMLDQADRHPGAEHGTAKWGSAHRLNIKYRNTKDSKENYILTENVRFSTDSHAHKHNLNIIVIGGSGSGKTRFYVKPNALQLIGSYLFLDPKGELTRTLGRIMETKGISVTVLDLVHFQGHYNPMAYLETDEDAIKLAFAIVNNTKPKDAPSGGDKFWDDSSVLLISALILYLMYEAPASEQNFSTLMYMILNCQVSENEMVENPLMMLFGELERRDPQHPAVLQFKSFMLGAKKTLQSILISAAANLYMFNSRKFAEMTSRDEMFLPRMGLEQRALFIVLPDNDTTFNFIATMLYTQLFDQLFRLADSTPEYNGALPVHVRLMMDEFAKVTGYLTQKHGFYYVVLNLPTDEKGKRNRKTLSTGLSTDRNATKAKALLLTMIREANAGEEVRGVNERQPKSQNKTEDERWNSPWPGMLFSDYLEFWLQWKRKSWEEITYSGYCQNVRSWIGPYFAKRKVRLNEITVLDIEMFYTHEINKRGISGNTVLHYHANIRKALSDAAKLKLIPYNPAAEVERPKKDNFVASYYSADELMEVLPIFANTKMELPVMLAAFYGLRRSEVIGLQWSAIDFERKIVTISRTFERINVDGKMVDVSKCRTKNKASFRSLPLIPAVEQALLKAQKRQHQQMKLCGGSYCKEYKDYICVDDMGHLVTPDYVTRVFREMLLKNGFRPIRYHDLRHSCASLLIKNKVTMKEVQMWLGHSSFSTTANIYAHIDVDSKMEAANMIASKINLGELPEKKKSPKQKIA